MSDSARPQQPLLVITGPTASGKTALGLELARIFGGELIGADSVQVYRGFDIGSSKPTAAELGGIPHHLLDVRPADQPLDAVDFAAMADAAIEGTRARGHVPIVVGGSGLWLRALLRGLVELPPVDAALRERLDEEARALGTEALHQRLQTIDPLAAKDIHPNDRVRVVRALEVFEQTGRPLGSLRAAHALGSPRYRALRIVLEVTPDELTRRIEARTEQMLAQGLIEEVRGLLTSYPRDTRALGSVGYREVVEHLCDGVSLEETQRKINQVTRIYARRQRTWLNNEPGELWLTTRERVLSQEGLARLRAFWAGPS
ncbi:MAG: tRNA (adenosine(37)-N6)-dimethylallyltransferase MiaA [Myxococcales bacterium]